MSLARPLFENIRRSRAAILFSHALFLSTLGGCATTSNEQDSDATLTGEETLPARTLPETSIHDSRAFDEESLYSLIAAELALTRAHYKLGLASYVEQARSSRDVNVTARAAQVARILKRHPESLEMAELWHELDPGSREARFILVSEYLHSQEFDAAFSEAEELLEAGHSAGFEDIAVDAVDNDFAKLDELKRNFERLHARYPDDSSLSVGLSVIYQYQKQPELALTAIDQALKYDTNNIRAIYQKYRVLNEMGRKEEATTIYSQLVALQPDNIRVRSRYAHQLIRIDRQKAMAQYQILHEQDPQNHDILLNLGLLQLDQKRFEEARGAFTQLLARGEHEAIAHFSLAEILKADGNLDAALQHYLSVDSGSRYVEAVSSTADILARTASFDEAIQFIIDRREAAGAKEKEELYLVEGNALHQRGLVREALASFTDGIAAFPGSVTLHYSRAMIYASLRKTALAEHDFKVVIAQAPDNAMTLNALGYTLLDQTDRIDDAAAFIEKAYALDPNDAAIIDSMGWLAFKRGDTKTALTLLRQAIELTMDDEIAAHLGEALWVAGRKKEARRVLQQGLTHNAESPHIRNTVKRLQIEL